MAVEYEAGWGRKVRQGRMWLDVVRMRAGSYLMADQDTRIHPG